MANSETSICNLGLSDIGANRLNNLDSDTSLQSILCRLHYEPMRDALLRSFRWRFAAGRSQLTEDGSTPDFEYSAQFVLPTDFLAVRSVYADNSSGNRVTNFSYAVEGLLLLTNEGSVDLRYTKKITDATLFDPLFVQVLAKQLSIKLVSPLAGAGKGALGLKESLKADLNVLMRTARRMDRQETENVGRKDQLTWNDARNALSGRIISQMGS